MKKLSILFLALTTALSSPAWADHYRGYGGHYRPPPPEYHHHHHSSPSWVGPAAVLAITGLALGAMTYQRAQEPVYVAPVTPQPPANGYWYYCASSGQYYPYTQFCPEGWRAVVPQAW